MGCSLCLESVCCTDYDGSLKCKALKNKLFWSEWAELQATISKDLIDLFNRIFLLPPVSVHCCTGCAMLTVLCMHTCSRLVLAAPPHVVLSVSPNVVLSAANSYHFE